MRRSSVITIILLVLVIVGLVVALVVTNVDFTPKDNDVVQENQEISEQDKDDNTDNANEEESSKDPTYISLDSEIVANMYDILNCDMGFYTMKKGYATAKELTDNTIQHVAFTMSAKNKMSATDQLHVTQNGERHMVNGKWTKADMDASVKEIFGDISYNPSYFVGEYPEGIYIEEEQMYYHLTGFGGAAPYGAYEVHGITNVAEYSDRYEVTEKYLDLDCSVEQREGNVLGASYIIQSWVVNLDTPLDMFKKVVDGNQEVLSDLPTEDELLDGVEMKQIYSGKADDKIHAGSQISTQEERIKLLSKYYDQATEYKHTFMKNSDGTYYWVKSEIIK